MRFHSHTRSHPPRMLHKFLMSSLHFFSGTSPLRCQSNTHYLCLRWTTLFIRRRREAEKCVRKTRRFRSRTLEPDVSTFCTAYKSSSVSPLKCWQQRKVRRERESWMRTPFAITIPIFRITTMTFTMRKWYLRRTYSYTCMWVWEGRGIARLVLFSNIVS